jgi:hypothetical protein
MLIAVERLRASAVQHDVPPCGTTYGAARRAAGRIQLSRGVAMKRAQTVSYCVAAAIDAPRAASARS